jgi:hypothetical protein
MTNESSIQAEIFRRFGSIEAHRLLEIIDLDPSPADLDVAAGYMAGMSDVLGEERQPLTGKAAIIYDLLRQDELLAEEEHEG